MRRRLSLLLIICFILLTLTGCQSSDYKKAVSLFESGNYSEAVTLFEELGDYEDSADKLIETKHELMLETYKDVYSSLDGKLWYFNGGSDTTLNRISFDGETVTIAQVYFDGNRDHDNGSNTFSLAVDNTYLILTMDNGSETKIPYVITGETISLGAGDYFTPEQVLDGLQGYWNLSKSEYILGLFIGSEFNAYIEGDHITTENATTSSIPSYDYFYYGPYSGNFEVGFGKIETGMEHGNDWMFNIIDGSVVLMNFDSPMEKINASSLPGQNGYSF